MIKSYFDEISSYVNFLLEMTKKEIKARYKNAVLGFFWIILNPFLQMAIIGFVFQHFIKIPVENYFLFLFAGLLPWNFFSYSITKTTPSIVYERDLIQKAKFPRETIPLSIVLSNFFHFLISLLLLTFFLIFKGQASFFLSLSATGRLLAALVWLLSITGGFSLLTASLNVKFRDINFFVQALSILWFYATPVIYSLKMLPENLVSFYSLNPIAYPFELLRSALLNTTLPPLSILFPNLLISVIIIFSGLLVFRLQHQYFSDWL